MALGEKQVITETKKALINAGVNVASLEEYAAGEMDGVKRSNHVTLVKNLPYGSLEGELGNMFGKFGNWDKTILPPSPSPSPSTRLWRPAAQRNLRNQWSKLSSYKQQWFSSSSSGRSHATSLVNSYLSHRYMGAMELGVLSDMPNIRRNASAKLLKQQELHRGKLLSSYEDMVTIISHMVNTSSTMRCYIKGASSSPIMSFSSFSEDKNDTGDGGGISVFRFWPIAQFEALARELVQMFELELILKRLLVMKLCSISAEEVSPVDRLLWSDELYPGEFDKLSMCNLFSNEASEPIIPRLKWHKFDSHVVQADDHEPTPNVLQVYLTTWLAEVCVDACRVDEIFALAGAEMQVSFP